MKRVCAGLNFAPGCRTSLARSRQGATTWSPGHNSSLYALLLATLPSAATTLHPAWLYFSALRCTWGPAVLVRQGNAELYLPRRGNQRWTVTDTAKNNRTFEERTQQSGGLDKHNQHFLAPHHDERKCASGITAFKLALGWRRQKKILHRIFFKNEMDGILWYHSERT